MPLNSQGLITIDSLINELTKSYKRMTVDNTIIKTRIINVGGLDVVIGVKISINVKHYPDPKCIVGFKVTLTNIPFNIEIHQNHFNDELVIDKTDYDFNGLYELIKKTFIERL